jgi:hypothetical protein
MAASTAAGLFAEYLRAMNGYTLDAKRVTDKS